MYFSSLIDSYQNCVCICITGLHQILTRYPQHYRALNRLAIFYANFLNDKVYDFSSCVNKLALIFLFSKRGWNMQKIYYLGINNGKLLHICHVLVYSKKRQR